MKLEKMVMEDEIEGKAGFMELFEVVKKELICNAATQNTVS